MMRFQAGHLAARLSPMLLLAACDWSGTHHATRVLDNRLQRQLAPAIAIGKATLQPLPAGARVSVLPSPVTPDGKAVLDDKDRFVLDSVIEGLLDPRLLRIDVADPSAAQDSLQAARVRMVTQYFVDYALGPSLQPADLTQATSPEPGAAPPAGLTITINVECAGHHQPSGYGSGRAVASCN